MYSNKKSPTRFALMLFATLALGACGGGGGSDDFSVGGGPNAGGGGGAGGGAGGADNPDIVNGFDLSRAELVLSGPSIVGAGSTTNYTATLLNRAGVPPDSPPGINVELTVTGDGFTNPPDGDNTDADGEFQFQFLAPDEGGIEIIRAQVFNNDDEVVLNEGITITVLESLFQFTAPAEDAQIRLGEARGIQFNWRIGNEGATTGDLDQGNPSAVTFTLAGRPAGGGFRLGGVGSPQSTVVVNIVNGQLDQLVEVVAGDTGGPVDILATASTQNESLQARQSVVFVGDPARIEATPTNIGVAPNAAENLNVVVFDFNNTPLTGIPLRIRISTCISNQRNTNFCNASGEQISNAIRTTDSDGQVSTVFIAGDDTGGGEIEITVPTGPDAGLSTAIAYNVGAGQSSSGNENTNNSGTTTEGTTQAFNFPSSNTQIPLNASQDIVFNVRDDDGPVAGEPVAFTLTRGFIDDNPDAAPAPAASRSFTTNASGDIRFRIFSTEAGLATLSGGSIQLDVEFIPSLESIAIQAANASIAPGGTNTITATALDANDDPIEGIFLQFIIDSPTSPPGSRSPSSGISDAQGQVTTVYTASEATGNVVIRASNQNQITSGSTDFMVVAP